MTRRDFSRFCASVVVVSAAVTGWAQAPAAANAKLPTLFLVGDAVAGWGTPVAAYFDPAKIRVVTQPMAVRASMKGSEWETLLKGVKSGDVILLQFGPPAGEAAAMTGMDGVLPGIGDDMRGADDPKTKPEDIVHTYGWYLRKFAVDTIAHGATPILASPGPQNTWTGGKIQRTTATYDSWARSIATQQKIPFIDVDDILAGRYDAAGQSTAGMFFEQNGQTSAPGSGITAEAVVSGLQGLPHDPLAGYLSAKGKSVAGTKPAPTNGMAAQ